MSNPKQMLQKIDPHPWKMSQFAKALHGPVLERCQENLFEDRNWLLPPNYLNNDNKSATGIASPKPPIKEESEIGEQSIISPKAEKCGWGLDCPFCKNQDKEDLDGKHQSQLQERTPPQPEIQRPQARCPQTLNYQKPQTPQKSNQETQIDKYPSQTKIHEQWAAEMERLNN